MFVRTVVRQSNTKALFKDVIVKLLKLISVCKVERLNEANGPVEPCLYTVAEPLVVTVKQVNYPKTFCLAVVPPLEPFPQSLCLFVIHWLEN